MGRDVSPLKSITKSTGKESPDALMSELFGMKARHRNKLGMALDMYVIEKLSYAQAARAVGLNTDQVSRVARSQKWRQLRDRYHAAFDDSERELKLTEEARLQAERLLEYAHRNNRRLQLYEQMLSQKLAQLMSKMKTETITNEKGQTVEIRVPEATPSQIEAVMRLQQKLDELIKDAARLNVTEIKERAKRAQDYIDALEARRRTTTATIMSSIQPLPESVYTKAIEEAQPAVVEPVEIEEDFEDLNSETEMENGNGNEEVEEDEAP